MDSTLTFTVGQMFAFVGVVCFILLTVFLVRMFISIARAANEAKALIKKTHDTLDDVRDATEETIKTVTDGFGKLKTGFKVATKLQKFKQDKGDE